MTALPPPTGLDEFFGSGQSGPKPASDAFFDSLDPIWERGTEMAQGIGEQIGYQVAAGAKAAADSIAHIGTLGIKAIAAGSAMAIGESPSAEWDRVSQGMQNIVGTRDPGALEVAQLIGRSVGLDSGRGPTVGRQIDETVQNRLGQSAIVGQTVGSLLSFVAGPGAAVGRAGAQVARPLANVIERVSVRSSAARAGIGREVVDSAISQGRGWEMLASMPKWQQSAGIIDRTMAAVGRSNMQLLETTAANIAQSYAMAPDDQRLQGAVAATWMSPFMVPIARTGEMLAQRVASLGLSGAQAKTIKEAFDLAETGKISMPELDQAIRQNSSRGIRGLANGIAGAAEGTAFMSMDPSAWEEMRKWQGGDAEAGARLLAMWAGTAVGVVATKGLLPQDLAPMFRTVRPDANTLSTYIDAERNKRLAQQEPEKPQPPREPSKADGIYSGQDQPVQLPGAMRSPDAQPPKKGKGKLAPGDPTQDITRPPEDRSDVRLFGGVDADSPAYREQKAQEEWRAYDRQMRSTYGWAQTYADGPLRAGFTPTFEADGNVRLNHGRDFSVTLVKEQNPNIDWSVGMTLRMDPKVGAALRDYGRPLPEYKLDPAGRFVEISGQDAVKALNDLTMLGAYRQLEGALQYQRAGFTEVEPGVWRSDDGIYHTRQLDGSTATKGEFDGDKWTATADFVFLGDFGQPVYDGPTLQALEQWVVRKAALAPDPLVDGILGHAASIARYGNGIGAQGLRQRLDAMTRIDGMLNPTYDRHLAMTLAELASGNNNAQHAAKEAPRRMAPPAATPEQPRQAEQGMQAEQPRNPSWSPDDPQPRPEEPFGARVNRLQDDPPKEAVAGSIGAGLFDAKAAEKATRESRSRAYDFIVEQKAEVIAKQMPGEKLPYEIRRISARGAAGEGDALNKFRVASKALKTKEGKQLVKQMEPIEGDANAQKPAWLGVAQLQRAPQNSAEKAIAQGFQDAGLGLYNKARDAGEVRLQETEDGIQYGPLPERDVSFVQRSAGKHRATVFNDENLRLAYFQTQVNISPEYRVPVMNPDTGKPMLGPDGKPQMRRGTAADMNEDYKTHLKESGFDPADEAAATEFVRRFKEVAYVWKGPDGIVYEVFETNPYQVMKRAAQRQAWRTATVEQYGQGNIPETARRALLENPATPPEVRANLERGGVQARKERFEQAVANLRDTSRAQELRDLGAQLLTEVQGVSYSKATEFTRRFRPVASLWTAARAAKGFIYDFGDAFLRNPVYGGWARSYKAIAMVSKDMREAAINAQRVGAMQTEMGDWVMSEAKHPTSKVADFFGTPAAITERAKGAVASKLADLIIADAKAGKATTNDLQIAQDILRLSAEDVLAIKAGNVSKDLETQWRKELVELLTGRVRPVDGSRMSSNVNWSGIIPFTKWITKRTSDTVRTVASVRRAAQRSGWSSKETGVAMTRLLSLASFGTAVNGLAGIALGQFFTGLMSGRPVDEGLDKTWTLIKDSSTAGLWQGFKQATIGGPMSTTLRVAQNPDDATALAGMTIPSSIGLAVFRAGHAFYNRDWRGTGAALSHAGFIPFRSDLDALRVALFSTQAVADATFDAKAVREWRRERGIKATYGTRDKEPEFYKAIAKVMDKVRNYDGDATAAVKEAMTEIREALALAPEDSVAASIEGHQLIKQLSNKDRADLEEWVNDSARMTRIGQHDAGLRDIAALVRKMEGVNPTEWQSELSSVRKQASLGITDRWDALVQRTLDDSMNRMLADEDQGSYVDELAEAMAEFPEQLRTSLGEKAAKRVSDPSMDTLTRARRIAAILRGRVRERAKSERERLRKEARTDG